MTTQELYNKVVAGEVTQQKFLYEVRRDINLPFITSSNNFKDTVQILKNKGMISEKKLSTGKQDVEIYAKTIDMVNPYEYTRGMNYELGVVVDAIGNRISDNAGDSMHIEDLTKDDVLKAQKKVLKNLTKNPQYYQQKLIPQMEGETELPVEVNAKSIEALKKKAGKIIREHGEDYEAVSKVMGNVSQLEEEELEEQGIDSEHVVKFKLAGNNYYNEATFIGTIPVNQLRTRYREGNEIEDYDGNSKKIVDVQINTRPRGGVEENVSSLKEDALEDEHYEILQRLAKFDLNSAGYKQAREDLQNYVSDRADKLRRSRSSMGRQLTFDDEDLNQIKEISKEEEDAKKTYLDKLNKLQSLERKDAPPKNIDDARKEYEDAFKKWENTWKKTNEGDTDSLMEKDTDYDRAKDAKRLGKKGEENIYGAGVKKGEEIAAKKMAAKRETIYEKYAQKYGVDVNDVKDRLEAYKLKQEEAIEVEDEATAISVQKKSPDADVRIIEK